MTDHNVEKDPFNWGYVLLALVVLLTLPLMHVFLAWFVYYL